MKLLKKQGVAWVITACMILLAIGTGGTRAAVIRPEPVPQPDTQMGVTVVDGPFYVYDEADVLSAATEEKLSQINLDLYEKLNVLIGVVTTNYGGDDLYSVALEYADNIGLGGRDFIVVLDISGENYWLVQGAELVGDFTDTDCGDYAWNYMERDFARRDYDAAVLELAEALETWYYEYF